MNKSRWDDSDMPGNQNLDKLDNFWIDLNEATAMRSEAKTQIYSINKNLPADQVARMWCVLDQLERTRQKRKEKWRSRRKVNCRLKVEFVCWSCDKSFIMDGVHIYSLDILAGYSTPNLLEKKYLNKLILRYTDSNFPFRRILVDEASIMHLFRPR